MQLRVVAGALLTPLIATITHEAILLSDPDIGKHFSDQELRDIFLILMPTTYAYCFVLGVPLYLFLKRKGRLAFWTFSGSSGVLALSTLCIMLLAAFLTTDTPHWERLQSTAILAPLAGTATFGLFVGAVFCTISGITWRSIGHPEV